jgi:hypothetical protein
MIKITYKATSTRTMAKLQGNAEQGPTGTATAAVYLLLLPLF